MRHIFIINPSAGRRNIAGEMERMLGRIDGSIDRDLYVTSGPGDATRHVESLCLSHPGEEFCFYACGGDGTLNEVVAGAVGHGNARVTCYPSGSGNDYVKYYGGREGFLDIAALVGGEVREVDIMRVEPADGDVRYSLNVCNFGFDAIVCKTMEQVRRKWLIGGRNAYTTGIVKALFTGRRTCCSISVDGSAVHDGDMLLCTLGNGRYVGGAYMCSPLSRNDDGLIEVCMFKPLSIIRFAKLIGSYREGSFIHRDDVKDKMVYRRGRSIDIDCPQPIDLCVDGELLRSSRFHVEQLPKAIRFVVPRGLPEGPVPFKA